MIKHKKGSTRGDFSCVAMQVLQYWKFSHGSAAGRKKINLKGFSKCVVLMSTGTKKLEMQLELWGAGNWGAGNWGAQLEGLKEQPTAPLCCL